MEIKLKSGHTVTMREPESIKHRDRKKLFAGVVEGMNTFDRGYTMTDNTLALAITDWSFDLLPPNVRRESLDDLDPADYDEIAEAAMPFLERLIPGSKDESDPKASTDS